MVYESPNARMRNPTSVGDGVGKTGDVAVMVGVWMGFGTVAGAHETRPIRTRK
jgi:hypothetical protein